jgi:hypothetical protein
LGLLSNFDLRAGKKKEAVSKEKKERAEQGPPPCRENANEGEGRGEGRRLNQIPDVQRTVSQVPEGDEGQRGGREGWTGGFPAARRTRSSTKLSWTLLETEKQKRRTEIVADFDRADL